MEKHTMDRNQFHTLLLLYAANVDMKETEREMQYIRKIAPCDNFDEMHTLFLGCSDYECLQLILSYRDQFFPTVQDQENLLQEVTNLLHQDGDYGLLEANAMKMIKKLIHQ